MNNIPYPIVHKLCSCYGNISLPLYYAGGHSWSDGVIYRFHRQSQEVLIKIMEYEQGNGSLYAVKKRIEFLKYLSAAKADVIQPIHSDNSRILESVIINDKLYIAYAWEMVKGEPIIISHPKDRTDFYYNWGKVLGKMHRLAKGYPDWLHSQSVDNQNNPQISWESEWNYFYNRIPDERVKQTWQQIKDILESVPKTRDNFGFIHNDAHPNNILVQNKQLILIDFDVANFHWFILDIAICVFSEYSRCEFHSPYKDQIPMLNELFLIPFMSGYESENTLADDNFQHFDIFLLYRKVIMFAVFYDEIKKNAPDYLSQMISEIVSFSPIIPKNTIMGKYQYR